MDDRVKNGSVNGRKGTERDDSDESDSQENISEEGQNRDQGVKGKDLERKDIINDEDKYSYLKLSEAEDPIAIIGMGMRLPGGIHDATSLWNLLISQKDARCRIPPDRYNIDTFYGPHKPGHVISEYGYFLEDVDLRDLDTSFFSMTKNEVERMDPQQRQLLEVVYECLQNGGQVGYRGKNIGVFVGSFGDDWAELHAKETQDGGMYQIMGYSDFVLPNRISYEFDFTGPSVLTRTACSSSLIALHQACESIRSGQCTEAIVAGTNIILSPTMTIAMSEQGVLSPDGNCKSFDADADGYARGEGISAIHIKPLSEALKNGDPIRSIIRATAMNSDGKTSGLSYPKPESQEALIRRAYDSAGITDFSKTAFVECHGTGTAIGDPLEAKAIGSVFGEKGVYIGSIKPNLGHLEGASGITSVIKAILSLENRIIPPNVKFHKPNPKIPWDAAQLRVPVEPTSWPVDRAKRISINSFGIGGANAHVILDSAASIIPTPKASLYTSSPQLLLFSANHPESLKSTVAGYERFLADHPQCLAELSYTLGSRREHLPHRNYAVITSSSTFAVTSPMKSNNTPEMVFVFTGQGAQWPRMGATLMKDYPTFRATIRELDQYLYELDDAPKWTIEDELSRERGKSRIQAAEFSQPCCTAVQIGLIDLFRYVGVFPKAVTGHSSGEIAAAYACGAISAKEAIIIAFYRGKVTKKLAAIKPQKGAMAAVGLERDEAAPFLLPGVSIACENSPNSVTISGDKSAVDEMVENIKSQSPDTFVRHLRVEIAYHSNHMREVEDEYLQALMPHINHEAKNLDVPFFSSVYGKVISDSTSLGPHYWCRNLISPVLFHTAVKNILHLRSNPLFLEVGPHSALAGPIRQIISNSGHDFSYLPTLLRDHNSTESFLHCVGQLFQHSVDISFHALHLNRTVLTDLPNYPWNHENKYWSESRLSHEWRLGKFPHHDLLGSAVIESNPLEPSWRNVLRLDTVPWLRDHCIGQDIVFPGAGYIASAGEAIRQLTGSSDYTVKHVNFSQAMVLHESTPTEVFTHLRRRKLNDNLDSSDYDFTILSYNGTTWSKHCDGQVRAGFGPDQNEIQIKSYPRVVDTARWYQAIKSFGLNYGRRFRCLQNISGDPSAHLAAGHITKNLDTNESSYALHPTLIDCAFQGMIVAAYKGSPRLFNQLSVPRYIEKLQIRRTESNLDINATVCPPSTGVFSGDTVGVDEIGTVVFNLKGLKLATLGDETKSHRGADPHAGVELVWRPDLDFLDLKTLLNPAQGLTKTHLLLEKLAVLCMLESSHQLSSKHAGAEHMTYYWSWLDSQMKRMMAGTYKNVEDISYLTSLSTTSRSQLIESLHNQCHRTEASACGAAIYQILQNIVDIYSGQCDPLVVLHEFLPQIYDYTQLWDYRAIFQAIGHSKPNLKILEIGAGTGGTTAKCLDYLVSNNGERMYYSYTYTDVSSGFFVAAKERFLGVTGIEYKVLDISQDPLQQGFDDHSFDLIIASNVIHATPRLQDTLRHVHILLRPDGRFFLQELSPRTKWLNYIMGTFPGWWLGRPDNRINEPILSSKEWEEQLIAANFQNVHNVAYDGQFNSNFLASPRTAPVTKRITFLVDKLDNPAFESIKDTFLDAGYETDECTLSSNPPLNRGIVSLLDLTSPFIHDITEAKYQAFHKFINRLGSQNFIWVTKSSQVFCKDPRYSMILGLARTLRLETELQFATLELDEPSQDSWYAIVKVYEKLVTSTLHPDPQLDPDYEWAVRKGVVYNSRFSFVSVSESLKAPVDHERPKKLEAGKKGVLQSLRWVETDTVQTKGRDVEVEMRAVGLNFKDVLLAMGIVDSQKSTVSSLGCEGSGVISKAGPDSPFKPGDRVMVSANGTFASKMVVPSNVCIKVPDHLTFVDAASMACVYTTVIHSLLDKAQLDSDQTILIHSACGGIGLAAIQIAQMVGAKIFATVGNEDKAKHLIDAFGIPRNQIFNSRDKSFVDGIMEKTDGRGVDVVLNSLSGELLHASWKCVAEFGIMVEIGKRDLLARGRLNMAPFEHNRSYIAVDSALICAERPLVASRLLKRCMEFYQQEYIKPIRPVKVFTAEYISEAMRYMQSGTHIGKIVIQMPERADGLQVTPRQSKLQLRPESSYLLAGGLGGLGRCTAIWMAEHGAQNLLFISPSASTIKHDDPFRQELLALGCHPQFFGGSVASIEDVQDAIKKAKYPVAGVMQLSMVLKDRHFDEMTFEDWKAPILPKVQGTWNLHEALKSQPLDFFLLFNSWSGLRGENGQANYAAANTFLDAFVQFRHQQRLPASVLDIGVMEDIGYVSRHPAALEHFRSTATYTLREQDLLDSLQLLIQRSMPSNHSNDDKFVNKSQLAFGLRSTLPLDAPNNRATFKRNRRMAVYRNTEASATSSTTSTNKNLSQFLLSLSSRPELLKLPSSTDFLAQEIGNTLFSFMLKPIEGMNIEAPLDSIGVDSLVAIELRNWFRQKVGVEVSVLEIVGSGSMRELGLVTVGKLGLNFGILDE